jgi:tripartite-type tricarboxylate transporter receptor subunit TctC
MATDLRERLAGDIRTVAADPEIIARLTATGQVISPGSSAEFAAAIEEQRAQVAAVGRALGMKPSK